MTAGAVVLPSPFQFVGQENESIEFAMPKHGRACKSQHDSDRARHGGLERREPDDAPRCRPADPQEGLLPTTALSPPFIT